MQAMDTSNVCLVQMELNADSFDPYRCDKNMILGIDLKKWVLWFAGILLVLGCFHNSVKGVKQLEVLSF